MVIKVKSGLLLLVFFYLLLTGCDPLKYAHGTLHSAARINIELSEPKTLPQLYPLYVEAAEMGGFLHSKGRSGSYTLEELYSDSFGGSRGMLIWVENENSTVTDQYSVIFISNLKGQSHTTSVTFVFGKGNTESFTKEEWLMFFNFKDNILPQVFPSTDIRISEIRHPAVFTDDETLLKIQAETDIEIPEKYLQPEE